MNNNLVLPLLALILSALSVFLPISSGGDAASPPNRSSLRAGGVTVAIAIFLFAIATFLWPKTYESGISLPIALGIGGLVGVAGSAMGMGRRPLVIALAVFGASILHFDFIAGKALDQAQIAFVAGAFIGAFAGTGIGFRSESGHLAAFASLLIVAADSLGKEATVGSAMASAAAWSGVVLGLCVLLGLIVSALVSRSSRSELAITGSGVVILLAAGYLASWKYLGSTTTANLWFGGVVVGSLIHLILAGGSKEDSFRFILSAVIWLGAATIAFAMDQGYGMAAAVLGGAAALILFSDIRGLMTLGVAAAILVYRLFREMFPSEARALDIGQHYTMIGLVIGALLPLLPIEWSKSKTLAGWREGLAGAMWLIMLLGLPIGGAILLGSKGAIGMVVGLSFAGIVEALRGVASLATLSIAAGIGSVTILTYQWLGDWADLEHGAKVRAVWIIAALALVLAGAFYALTRNQTAESQPQ